MPDVMLALGDFRFSIDTAAVGSIERATAWRWPAEERTGAAPVRQYTGPGEETLTLRGVIYPDHRGGLGQVDRMREMAGTGAALRLVDGWSGRDRGLWVITRIRETVRRFWPNGRPRRQEFLIELAAYHRDDSFVGPIAAPGTL